MKILLFVIAALLLPATAEAAPDDSVTPPEAVVKVVPQVRVHHCSRSLKGWVDMEFDVSATGVPENIVVTAAEPKGYFERASMRALMKWKFKPAVSSDGQAVAFIGLKERIEFSAEKMCGPRPE